MVRCFLLSVTDHRARTNVDWGGVVEESSKHGPSRGCGLEGSLEGGRDGGQGPSLGLEDGTSKDGRAKRHLNVSPANRGRGTRTLAMIVFDPEATIKYYR